MPIYQLAALGTATCWALTGPFSSGPATYLGAASFNRLRQPAVTLMLAATIGLSGSWQQITPPVILPLILSGILGVTLGDTLNFATVVRLGPRRAGVIFALNTPIAALLGWLILGETLSANAALGILLAFLGTALAIRFGRGNHTLESITGTLQIGIAFGLLVALGQASGSLIARPIMQGGMDPFAASLNRVGFAGLALSVLMTLPIPSLEPRNPLNRKVGAQNIALSFIGLMVGMTLMLFALSGGKVGIISTLTATSPVIILPMLWLRTGERPTLGAWAGAALVVTGIALIFAH